MILLPQKRVWARQPQSLAKLRRNIAITADLQLAYCPGIGEVNLANNKFGGRYTAFGTTYARIPVADGQAIRTVDGGACPRFVLPALGTSDCTILLRTIHRTAASTTQYSIGTYASGVGLAIYLAHGSDANRWGAYSTGTRYTSASISPLDDTTHTYVIKQASGIIYTYYDGKLQTSYSKTPGNVTTTNWEVNGLNTIGVSPSDTTAAYVWFRGLSDDEITSVSANPWQIFSAADSRIFVPTDTGPTNVILTATGISTSPVTLGSPSLAQGHSLTATAISTGPIILGAPALTVVLPNGLTAQDISTQPATLGTPSLAQDHVLSGSAIGTSPITLGAPALTVVLPTNVILAAANISTSPITLGAPLLAQNHTLSAGAIAAGPPVFGSPSLSQQHVLMGMGISTRSATLSRPTLTVVLPTPFTPEEMAFLATMIPTVEEVYQAVIDKLVADGVIAAPAIVQNNIGQKRVIT